MKIWEPKPSVTLWATPDLLRDSFTFTFIFLKLILIFLNKVINTYQRL